MTHIDWQQLLTLVLVALAAGALLRRLWRTVAGTDGGNCAGCGECGRPPKPGLRSAPKATPLVTLSPGSPERPRPRLRPPTPGA